MNRFRDSAGALWLCIVTCTAAWLCITIPVAVALNITGVVSNCLGSVAALLGIACGALVAHLWRSA